MLDECSRTKPLIVLPSPIIRLLLKIVEVGNAVIVAPFVKRHVEQAQGGAQGQPRP